MYYKQTLVFYVFLCFYYWHFISSWIQNGHFTLKMGFSVHDGSVLHLI